MSKDWCHFFYLPLLLVPCERLSRTIFSKQLAGILSTWAAQHFLRTSSQSAMSFILLCSLMSSLRILFSYGLAVDSSNNPHLGCSEKLFRQIPIPSRLGTTSNYRTDSGLVYTQFAFFRKVFVLPNQAIQASENSLTFDCVELDFFPLIPLA